MMGNKIVDEAGIDPALESAEVGLLMKWWFTKLTQPRRSRKVENLDALAGAFADGVRHGWLSVEKNPSLKPKTEGRRRFNTAEREYIEGFEQGKRACEEWLRRQQGGSGDATD